MVINKNQIPITPTLEKKTVPKVVSLPEEQHVVMSCVFTQLWAPQQQELSDSAVSKENFVTREGKKCQVLEKTSKVLFVL